MLSLRRCQIRYDIYLPMSNAKALFDTNISECSEAIALYEHYRLAYRFSPDFQLRFVWIASVSALDHYISELIIESATYLYGNKMPLPKKLRAAEISFQNAIDLSLADNVSSIVIFRSIINTLIRYTSFQSSSNIADGLAYIWNEKYKGQFIAKKMGKSEDQVKRTLGAIVDRRNIIAHNADIDYAMGSRMPVNPDDAKTVVDFITRLATVIDEAVISSLPPS